MKILVIGGTRFIGPAVVSRLVAMGHDVTLFHRGQTEATLQGVREIRGNRKELSIFTDEFRQINPDVVLDMFPFTEEDAKALMSTFAGIARRVVAISSADVYRAYGRLIRTEPGPADPVPLTEESPLREKLYPYRGETPRNPDDPRRWIDDYDKILVERTIMENSELPGTILRLPMVYGPRDNQHRLFEYLKRMDDRRPAIPIEAGLARWRWTRGYVEDVAEAIALAVAGEQAAGRIYNAGEAQALTTVDWVKQIATIAGWQGEVIPIPTDRWPRELTTDDMDTAQDLVVDTFRIRGELGFRETVPLETALERTIAWERAHPPEPIDPKQFNYAAEDELLQNLA